MRGRVRLCGGGDKKETEWKERNRVVPEIQVA